MKYYLFSITIIGTGDTADEAWDDATEAFSMDPGSTPEESEYTVEEVEED